MDGRKSGSRPQKRAFLRMNCQKSGSRPQNWAFLRMDGEKSGSCPQNWAFLSMDGRNPPVCSSLILVDYLAVLSLGKVDSVYKLHLIFVDLRVVTIRVFPVHSPYTRSICLRSFFTLSSCMHSFCMCSTCMRFICNFFCILKIYRLPL